MELTNIKNTRIKAVDPDWLNSAEFPLYSVSRRGQVRNNVTGKLLKPVFKNNRLYVNLYEGKNHMVRVDRLVVRTFIGLSESKLFIEHRDGDPRNCSVKNLFPVQDRPESEKRKPRDKFIYSVEDISDGSVMSADSVKEICNMFNVTYSKISYLFKLSVDNTIVVSGFKIKRTHVEVADHNKKELIRSKESSNDKCDIIKELKLVENNDLADENTKLKEENENLRKDLLRYQNWMSVTKELLSQINIKAH